MLEYPALRKTDTIFLSNRDREEIVLITDKITGIVTDETCPDKLTMARCKNCSYFDFCWSGETETEG